MSLVIRGVNATQNLAICLRPTVFSGTEITEMSLFSTLAICPF
jgi:hypothetical protein